MAARHIRPPPETPPTFDTDGTRKDTVRLVLKHQDELSRALQDQGRYDPLFEFDPRQDEVLWELWIGRFGTARGLRPQC